MGASGKMGSGAEIVMGRCDEFAGRHEVEHAGDVDASAVANRTNAQGQQRSLIEQRKHSMAVMCVDRRLPVSQDEGRLVVRIGASDLAFGQDDERLPLLAQGLRSEIEQRGVSPNLRCRLDFHNAGRPVAMDDQEVRRVEAPFRQVQA